MKPSLRSVTVLFSIGLLWISVALAGGEILPGKIGSYGRYYDVATEESFSARVVEVHQVGYSNSSKSCLALEVLPIGAEHTEVVYLGPTRRLEKVRFSVREGDEVCVVASRVSVEGRSILISKSVMDGYEEFVLRSDDGTHFNLDLRLDYERDSAVCTVAAVRVK